MVAGTRTITFAADGTYTSDIFTNGGGNITGSYLVLGFSVAVTTPNPPNFNPFVSQFESVVATSDSLKFILGLRPVGGAFQTLAQTVYLFGRI